MWIKELIINNWTIEWWSKQNGTKPGEKRKKEKEREKKTENKFRKK